MKRNEVEIPFLIERLTAFGENAPSLGERVQLAQEIRGYSKNAGEQVDRCLFEQLSRLQANVNQAKISQDQLREILDKLTAPPWHAAVFLGHVAMDSTGPSNCALVMNGNSRRVVTIAENLDSSSLAAGDEVLLGSELNMIVAKSPFHFFQSGQTASFDRYTRDRRLVLKWRDEEIVVDAAESLAGTALKSGDLVRWDRTIWMAFEKIERTRDSQLFLEETPAETFAEIGGLDHQIDTLQQSLRLHMFHATTVQKYRLRRKGSVLLVGPPGNGKTMLARALANWLAENSRTGRARFMNIKPASLHSMWYSQSEANYREAFRIAREAGEQEPGVPVVMFFDEVDAIGTSRGSDYTQVNDRVLTSFMTELDGMESRGNILVVAATNRADELDRALFRPGRLKDCVIEIPRPNMSAAREIMARYLRADIPYAMNGHGSDPAAIRQSLIESAVSRMYAPNGENELATITLRDGKRRAVRAADLMSGASIANIAREAVERACAREVETGEVGLQSQDLVVAIRNELESATHALTPRNCARYLTDLPQDVDVVRVEPIQRKVARRHRYLSAA
jgi:proteasome-associated ATPase